MNAQEIATKEDLIQLEQRLSEQISQLKEASNPPLKWMRSAQVRKLLSISPGTLQNLRIKGLLPYTRIGTILYYKLEDVVNALTKNIVK
jgi:hypothetical protein